MSGALDLLVHLTPCPVIVEVTGHEFTVPALDAVAWVRLLSAKPLDLYAIFPVLAGGEAVDAVEDALWDGDLTEDDVARLGLDVIAAVADRPWWVAVRTLSAVAGAWEHVHVNQASGVAFAGWLDLVWARVMAVIDPKMKASWVHQIEAAPKGWEQVTDFAEEEKAFLAAMRSAQ